MKPLIIILCLSFSSAAIAEVYKCKTPEGRFTYQEVPCDKNSQGGSIQLNVLEPSKVASVPVADPAGTVNEKEKAYQEFKIRHRLRNINDEIDNYQSQIRINNQQMEKELSNLRASKNISNNNLAGETRNIGISGEMEAVTSKYANKIKALEVSIETLRQEKNHLQK
ncbi:MAG: DUF4124 domain-containing protein [Burkholderiaceae bacterium]|nr:DUF4124 domain-containing protein [Burkholderiaceae bacterium]